MDVEESKEWCVCHECMHMSANCAPDKVVLEEQQKGRVRARAALRVVPARTRLLSAVRRSAQHGRVKTERERDAGVPLQNGQDVKAVPSHSLVWSYQADHICSCAYASTASEQMPMQLVCLSLSQLSS
jgi:hypothetical protein